MTRQEFEALLLKDGFEKNDKCDFCKCIYSNTNQNNIILKFFMYNDDVVFCLIESLNSNFNENIEISRTLSHYQDFTEQKLDEILSQCTKIKTALYQIEKITEELK